MTTQRRLMTCVGVLSAAILWGGATPASAANKFAAVNANGTLAFGNGVSSVTYLGPGRYEVRFTTNVSGCSYVATTLNVYPQAIQSYTAGGHVDANGVYVEVKNQGGGLMDGAFHLFVACAATGIKYAVVDYNGNLARGSGGTTVTNLALDVRGELPGRHQGMCLSRHRRRSDQPTGLQSLRCLHRLRVDPEEGVHRDEEPRRRAPGRRPVPSRRHLP